MSTPEDKIARSLRNDLEARIGAWKAEREQLLKAQERIAELDALIAYAEDETRQLFKVASPSRSVKDEKEGPDTPIKDRDNEGAA